MSTGNDSKRRANIPGTADIPGGPRAPGTAGFQPARRLPGTAGFQPASPDETPWRSRGYLPHFEGEEVPQAITFRLADSLPRRVVEAWRDELARLPEREADAEHRRRVERYLDAGHGAGWLRDGRVARHVEQALLHFDGERYRLHAWVIMPNHVHVVCTPLHGHTLAAIAHTWKSYTATVANKVLGRNGPFWQREYFDRAIRDERHFRATVSYVEANPVVAGLCEHPAAWPFGSARLGGSGMDNDNSGTGAGKDAGGPRIGLRSPVGRVGRGHSIPDHSRVMGAGKDAGGPGEAPGRCDIGGRPRG